MSSINLISGGLDVQTIVDNLIYVESAPVRRMQNQQSALQSKVSALQSFNSKLSSFLTKVDDILYQGGTASLSTPYGFEDRFDESVFSQRKAASSSEGIVSAIAAKGAASGSYAITVTSLAQAKAMASANFADTSTTQTGTGTLSIQVGSNATVNITIDGTNNTLDGVRKAINAANAGVSATIINDGSSQPYRLLITSNNTGTGNAFNITNNLSGGQALTLTQTAAAKDAQLTVNGVSLTKSSNKISDVIQGVTLNLKSETTAPATVTVTDDIDAMVNAIKALTTSYNDITATINAQTKYDPNTKTAGLLSGDATLRNIQTNLQSIFTQSISNGFTSYAVISQIGINFRNDGTLSVDESKLRNALTSDLKGTAALLLGDGTPADSVTTTDNRVIFNSKTPETVPGTYAVEISTAPQQASVLGGQAVTTFAQDETLTIAIGSSNQIQVQLTAGFSLSQALAVINQSFVDNLISAAAVDDGTHKIKIITSAYGSDQTISVTSTGTGLAGTTGFSSTATEGSGVDVAGTINGHIATGIGNTLTGAADQDEKGLILTIRGSSTGSYGSVTVASAADGVEGRSIIMNLRSALKNITNPLSGPIQSSLDGWNSNIHTMTDRISAYNDRLERRKEILTREYAKADQALKLLNVNQTSLNNQIASLSKIS